MGEQIIKDLKGQNKEVELYSKCDGQLLVGFFGGVSLDLLCFQISLALCGEYMSEHKDQEWTQGDLLEGLCGCPLGLDAERRAM